jgi:hypothetical protein
MHKIAVAAFAATIDEAGFLQVGDKLAYLGRHSAFLSRRVISDNAA